MPRLSVRDVFMRRSAPESGADWFRIEPPRNDAGGDGTEESTVTKVFIYDEIGFWGTSADDFVRELATITTPQIELHLNSPGGQIFDGIAIMNALQGHSAAVSVYVDALAASAASFIAQAADKGQLFMARNATMMIHDGLAATYGNEEDHVATAAILAKLSNNIADIYSQRAGGTVEEWRGLMQAETWYSAVEAVEAGLADSVVGGTDQTTDKWDLSIFNHAGRDHAPSPREVRQQVLLNTTKGTPSVTQPVKPPTPPTPPAAPVAPAAPTDTAPPVFMLSGVQTTDPAQVQTYIAGLETFRDEMQKKARHDFVATLVRDKKILVTQENKIKELVESLDPEQYKAWEATWEAAVATPLLGQHGGGATNTGGTQSGAGPQVTSTDPRVDQLAVARATVQNFRLSGLSQDAIEKTPSYQSMIRLEKELASA